MRKLAFVLAMVACCGCQGGGTEVAGRSEAVANTESMAPTAVLANRVWARSDSTGLPGVMKIFLSDGTLLMDSCWETYQLVKWRAESDSVLSWQEGNAEVRATVVELDGGVLVLRLALAGGNQEEHYRVASVPFLCPDMRR